jgi:hemerythrin-like domain-containing protein
MQHIKNFMLADHRHCDDLFAEAEKAVAALAWDRALAAFASFKGAMQHHFSAEEEVLFPAFEIKSGMTMGPTQVMRVEHAQMRELMAAAQQALLAKDADDYSGNTETLLIMMQQHNMKEEGVLYPMCDDHLRDQTDALLLTLEQQLGQAKGFSA